MMKTILLWSVLIVLSLVFISIAQWLPLNHIDKLSYQIESREGNQIRASEKLKIIKLSLRFDCTRLQLHTATSTKKSRNNFRGQSSRCYWFVSLY